MALIVDDPDAPIGTWVHWVVFNITPEVGSIPANLPKTDVVGRGGIQGVNDFRRIGYGGPCPPTGSTHRYFFKLYALDTKMGLRPGSSKADLERDMQGHILAQGELIGRYGR